MQRPTRYLTRHPRHALAVALALLPAALAACINVNLKGYPEVERSDVRMLAASSADTTWVLAKPPLTVVGRSRRAIDVPAGLTGVARGWERMFGSAPGPATVVLVELSDRGRPAPPPPVPDSLAGRTIVWVPTMRWDDGDRDRRSNAAPVAGTPVMMGGGGGSAALQLAQAWLDARLMREPSAGMVPAWLRAGIVEALGGNEGAPAGRRGKSNDFPRLPLDTLVARRCAEGWSPVSRWRPMPAPAPDTTQVAERRERRRRDRRTDESDPQRAFRESLQAPCGLGMRLQAGSFVRFLMDRGGDPMADRVLQTYLQGGRLEQAVAGAPGLPQTTAELDRAWRAWELDRFEEMRRAAGQ